MRLFVAVELHPDAVRIAADTAASLSRAVGSVGSTLRATWVQPENMHLTVRFIGHVDDARAPSIVDALSRPLDIPPFDVELAGCGMFPPSGPPRVIWIGLAQGLPLLAAMHDEFDRRLLPFGFAREDRPFSAHLTLARIKDAPKGSRALLRDVLASAVLPAAASRISRATIFRSHLSPKGPRYEPLAFADCRA